MSADWLTGFGRSDRSRAPGPNSRATSARRRSSWTWGALTTSSRAGRKPSVRATASSTRPSAVPSPSAAKGCGGGAVRGADPRGGEGGERRGEEAEARAAYEGSAEPVPPAFSLGIRQRELAASDRSPERVRPRREARGETADIRAGAEHRQLVTVESESTAGQHGDRAHT